MSNLIKSVGTITGRVVNKRPSGQRTLNHDFLSCVVRGNTTFSDHKTPDTVLKLPTLVYVKANTPHRFDPLSEEEWTNYWLLFDARETSRRYGNILPSPGHHQLRDVNPIIRNWATLDMLSVSNNSSWSYYTDFLLHAILVEIRVNFVPIPHKDEQSFTHQALKWMDNAWQSPQLDYQAFALKVGISYTHFRTQFKRETGLSPKQYVLQLKIKHAQSLLLNTTSRISEIAEQVGFDDPYYFTRLFKEKSGVSPKKFRNGEVLGS